MSYIRQFRRAGNSHHAPAELDLLYRQTRSYLSICNDALSAPVDCQVGMATCTQVCNNLLCMSVVLIYIYQPSGSHQSAILLTHTTFNSSIHTTKYTSHHTFKQPHVVVDIGLLWGEDEYKGTFRHRAPSHQARRTGRADDVTRPVAATDA